MWDTNNDSRYIAQYVDRAQQKGEVDFYKDIGLYKNELPYYGSGEAVQNKLDMLESEDDYKFESLLNGIFTAIDMTDY